MKTAVYRFNIASQKVTQMEIRWNFIGGTDKRTEERADGVKVKDCNTYKRLKYNK